MLKNNEGRLLIVPGLIGLDTMKSISEDDSSRLPEMIDVYAKDLVLQINGSLHRYSDDIKRIQNTIVG